jgi:predicted enzyme related to lactoylglutathione lyase
LELKFEQSAARDAALIQTSGRNAMAEEMLEGRPRWSIAPYFIVDDVVTTANYYRDKLGFAYERFWDEPPAFCMVHRNGATIMLSQHEAQGAMRPNHLVDPEGESWDTYVWVDNADRLYAEFTSQDVKITRQICDQPYGCRDFDVEDCNGYRLCFGHNIQHD